MTDGSDLMIVTSSRRPYVARKNTEAIAIVMERAALISPATSSVLGLRAGMTPFLCAGSFSYARESVETIPFTINFSLSLIDVIKVPTTLCVQLGTRCQVSESSPGQKQSSTSPKMIIERWKIEVEWLPSF